jgi:NAD(P)-dependent dehydrogenase (short-subunit alcohol dehydrogenase family)
VGSDFDGRVAIVTGAAGGINGVILTRLAEEGARCVLVDINDDWGESTASRLRGRRRGRRTAEASRQLTWR